MLQLFAPVTPHITEEIYQYMYKDGKGYQSIQVSAWPKYNAASIDEAAEKDGDLVIAVMSEIRRDKAEKKLSLKRANQEPSPSTPPTQTAVKALQKGALTLHPHLKIEKTTVVARERRRQDKSLKPTCLSNQNTKDAKDG